MRRRDVLKSLVGGTGALALAPDPSLDDQAIGLFIDMLETDLQQASSPQLTLMQFVEAAWPILEPDHPFVRNWHIDAIADHLNAVHTGDITNLLVNEPPQCMKSRMVSVFFPAWEWTLDPSLRYLCASCDQQLSVRDASAHRQIVESDWYRSQWPHVRLAAAQNQKTRFDTTRGGWRIATSIGGRGIGEHPHRKIIDDPHNVKRSLSAASRLEAVTWLDQTMSSRGRALNAATILIMQRLHEEDLSGHVIETQAGRWVHLCLPMRYEKPRHCVTLSAVSSEVVNGRLTFSPMHQWEDPRTEEGELLWPALFPAQAVADHAAQLGPYGDAGQLQQRPSPEGGGLFQREWFVYVDAIPADAQIVAWCRGWDGAGTEAGGDWTAAVLLALTKGGMVYVVDVVRAQVGPGADEKLLKKTAEEDRTTFGRAVRQREEQEPGSAGKKVIAAHAKVLFGFDYKGEHSTGDKMTRARPVAAQAAVGNLCVVRGGWNKAYLDELTMFPNAKHDDQVDATSIAFAEIALAKHPTVTVRKLTGW